MRRTESERQALSKLKLLGTLAGGASSRHVKTGLSLFGECEIQNEVTR